MGAYVNPENETKEKFLEREGRPVGNIKWKDVPEGFLPVILLDNFAFSAAGIAYSERELNAFTDPRDSRIKKIYLVPIEKLLPVSDLGVYL